ncbi:MAG TPA: FMN-binding negative transcriptional regulator [Anaeromyxobacteraceae bacterium]|nr:FMN-binding negative transcriptional regulator [Anaeromyxobacteraceae bacterium]
MYLPTHFHEKRLSVLHEAIERSGLSTLVSLGPDGMDASHVPMLLDRGAGPLGTLRGHVARANPQWRSVTADVAALAIFLGPDAYVTPSWYPTKRLTGRVVPTWNYVAIHAHGRARFFDDEERLLALVTKLTEAREARRARPWAVSDAPPDYIRSSLKAIVGFELPILKLEGKWKMSQNRTAEDRGGVASGLEEEGTPSASAVAAMVRAAQDGDERK